MSGSDYLFFFVAIVLTLSSILCLIFFTLLTVDLRLTERDTLTWPRAQTTLPQKFVGFDLIIRILVREERPTSYVFI